MAVSKHLVPRLISEAELQDQFHPIAAFGANGLAVSWANLSGAPETFNVINGTEGDDFIVGTPGDDLINALGGNDSVWADSGNDEIYGGDGDDILNGAFGDDHIAGGGGNDTLIGDVGIDTASYANASGGVEVDLGEGYAAGADGNDSLSGIENVIGSAFDDGLYGDSGANQILGLGGNDILIGYGGDDLLYGGDGGDVLMGFQGNDILIGGAGNDFFRGNAGDDVMDGGEGFDRVSFFPSGAPGNGNPEGGVTVSLLLQGAPQDTGHGMDTLVGIESLSGTPYDDVLRGDQGTNWLIAGGAAGGAGNDQLYGEGGDDLLELNIGDHVADGGAGNDTVSFFGLSFIPGAVTASLLLQGAAQDTGQGMMMLTAIENLSGTPFNDDLEGDANSNLLAGHGGDDSLIGGGGNDILYGDGAVMADLIADAGGESGPPKLFADLGLGGGDFLSGGTGDDILIGGGGQDVLTGGKGRDTFTFGPGDGDDRITDFENRDTIRFEGISGVDDFGDLTLTKIGHDTLITWGTGDSILVEGSKPSQLHAADFIFG